MKPALTNSRRKSRFARTLLGGLGASDGAFAGAGSSGRGDNGIAIDNNAVDSSEDFLTAPVSKFVSQEMRHSTQSSEKREAQGIPPAVITQPGEARVKRKAQISQLERQRRAEGLKQPIDAGNRGYNLLMKLGGKRGIGEDYGIGEYQQDDNQRTTPNVAILLTADGAINKEGLGISAKRARFAQIRTASAEQRENLHTEYINHRSRQYIDSRAQQQLKKSTATLYELELRALRQQMSEARYSDDAVPTAMLHPLVRELHRIRIDDPCNEEFPLSDHERESNEKEFSQLQLNRVLLCLRERHAYCFYCGCAYANQNELQSMCPGVEESLH